ncbi:uncharacterized protein M6B38_332440 [Iris pallida]|uniref:Uncharacterized protein n=1 Tax=Iris pallida TaxID=29817 RepID=A0AAX6H3M3_IRIPA|nr:uncharacterized protein M6B38_332440 [Iris pallida]
MEEELTYSRKGKAVKWFGWRPRHRVDKVHGSGHGRLVGRTPAGWLVVHAVVRGGVGFKERGFPEKVVAQRRQVARQRRRGRSWGHMNGVASAYGSMEDTRLGASRCCGRDTGETQL